ncbi:putative chloride channel-like protein CLC-g, partial [Phalaenopsis equestris]
MAIKAAADETEPLLVEHKSTSQLALVGSRVCPIESLDFEIAESVLVNQDRRARNGRVEIFRKLFLKWALCFLIGIFSACVGFFINLAIENIAGVKFVVTSNMMLAN